MSWKEIIEKHPLSIEKLSIWCQSAQNIHIDFVVSISMDAPQGLIFVPKNIRFLYDFFDKFPLYIILDQFDDGDFIVKITSHELDDETRAFCKDGHIEELYDSTRNTDVFCYEKRKDAEIHAFEQCFSLLEKRLANTPADYLH